MYEYIGVIIIALLIALFFVRSILRMVILVVVTLGLLVTIYLIKQKLGTKDKYSYSSKSPKLNIYGEKLEQCQPGEKTGGSQMNDGTCSELGGGVHQICVKNIGQGRNFSKTTGQSGWSADRGSKNHCACLGAWANYVAASKRDSLSNDKKLKCEAIPETALDKKYVKNWSSWNDVTIDNQLQDGIDELYNQCSSSAPNQKGLEFLQRKYNQLADLHSGQEKF